MKLYIFRTVRLSIIRSLFTVHSAMVYVIQVCRQLSSRTRMERSSILFLLEQLIYFHDHALIIITTVFYTIIRIIRNKQTKRFNLEGQVIETIWTIAPAIILVFIAIPSLRLLYLIDETHNPVITLKAVGHQWYWSYEYSDFTKLEFDSYTGCPRRNGPNFGRVFLMLNYTDITQNTYIQSWTVTEIMAREKCGQ